MHTNKYITGSAAMKIISSSKKSTGLFILGITLAVSIFLFSSFGRQIISSGTGTGVVSWGLRHNNNHTTPEGNAKGIEILNNNGGKFIGNTDEKKVYLTFDLGYEAGYTETVLDILKQNNLKAVFFITGNYLEKEPDLISRMIADGHYIGNHTYYHRDCEKSSFAEIREDITKLQSAFSEKYGISMQFYRPPQGKFYEDVIAEANSLDLTTLLWSFAYEDWGDNVIPAETAVSKIMARIHPGAILLLHLANETNSNMLPFAIESIKAEGYTIGDPADLLPAG